MDPMTFTSACCNAPVVSRGKLLRCAKCDRTLDVDGAPHTELFDHIYNGFAEQSDEVVEECVKSGQFYTPYVPLQVTKVKLK